MNNRRDSYLQEMEARLRSLPPGEREKEIIEVTQHVDALIAANERNGETEADATESAIAQFGAARDIGNRLYQTGKHKRFAPLGETALFCAAFSTLFILTEQIGKRAIQAVSPLPLARTLEMQITHWPLLSWPVSWSIGIAAFALLVLRYGMRGVVQKALGSTPTGAAVRWLFWAYIAGNGVRLVSLFPGFPGSATQTFFGGAAFGHLTPVQQSAVIIFGNTLSLLTAFAVAYFVGRGSKVRESVADAVGCAAAVGTVTSLLQMLFQLVPTPWGRSAIPVSFLENLSGYLMSFLTVGVYGILRVFVAYSGVQWGEKARPLEQSAKQVV